MTFRYVERGDHRTDLADPDPTGPTAASRVLSRGERGVAPLGAVTAGLLAVCVGATAWLGDHAQRDQAAAHKLEQLKAAGPLLAEAARQAVAANDLTALRRLTAATAADLGANECTVSIGNGRVVADGRPSRVNTPTPPDRWSVGSDDAPVDGLRFPFAVAGRGAGYVDLAADPAVVTDWQRFGPAALVCAVGLCVLIMTYRRSIRGLAELDVVRNALAAASRGETATPALLVDPRLGPAAAAWNGVMVEVEDLRHKAGRPPPSRRRAPVAAAGTTSNRPATP